MTSHSLLWIDMTVSVHDPATATAFSDAFNVHMSSALSSIESEIERVAPDVICFDYDFPTKQGLKLLQRIKKAHPSFPVLMLTVQHSEELAVWAFRSRVWDYLVKPLTKRDRERCVGCLTDMLKARDASQERRQAAMPTSVIPEENRAQGSKGTMALVPAIEYVEQHYREKISSARAAELCGMSPFQFSRAFREAFDVTFQEYVLRFRIRAACRLLKNPNAQVTEVAYLCGFTDPSYFARIFKRYTHLPPSQFATYSEASIDPERLLDVMGHH
jgi:YesN/AraC family two-component response regulator